MYTFTLFSGSTDENFENPTLTKVADFSHVDDAFYAEVQKLSGSIWLRQTSNFDKSQIRWRYLTSASILAQLPERWRSDLDVRTHFKVVE